MQYSRRTDVLPHGSAEIRARQSLQAWTSMMLSSGSVT